MSAAPEIPDLRSLLAEASRPSSSCTVPLKQGLRERIESAEAELERIAADAKPRRMSGPNPLKEKAAEIEALRADMAASALTFHFEAPTHEAREAVRKAIAGRDEPDELDLRATAACLTRVTAPDGTEYADRLDWTDLRDLRDRLGIMVYDATIKAASDEVWGPQWSVPFSPNASHILETER